MTDLDDVLAALLTSLAHARRMADEQSTAIARSYQANSLLRGLSVPRVRVPEMVVELPIIIESVASGGPPVIADPAAIVAALRDALARATQELNVTLPAARQEVFARKLNATLPQLLREARDKELSGVNVQEAVAAIAERAALDALAEGADASLTATHRERLVASIKDQARTSALRDQGRRTTLKTSVGTAEVKDKGTPASLTRVRLVLREEGLEWSDTRRSDGSSSVTLLPE